MYLFVGKAILMSVLRAHGGQEGHDAASHENSHGRETIQVRISVRCNKTLLVDRYSAIRNYDLLLLLVEKSVLAVSMDNVT